MHPSDELDKASEQIPLKGISFRYYSLAKLRFQIPRRQKPKAKPIAYAKNSICSTYVD
jgi:hypothetical protein